MKNTQVYFSELEHRVAEGFLNLQNTAEDIFMSRLYNLAHLTALVVFDDNDKVRSQNQDIEINMRNNGQFT